MADTASYMYREFCRYYGAEDRSGCVPWLGYVNPSGYGEIWTGLSGNGRSRRVHRYAYERVHGPIPRGYHVHHVCGNRRCVRLDHLQLLHRREHLSTHWVERQQTRAEARETGCQAPAPERVLIYWREPAAS